MRHITIAILFLMTWTTSAFAADACHLTRLASLDMPIDKFEGASVPMTVGDRTLHLLIDTGGVDSMLTQSAVKSLDLVTDIITGMQVRMFGGIQIDRTAKAHDVSFGNLKAPTLQFLVMPDGHMASNLDGTLAPDILRNYDADFDFANAKFSLFSSDHCTGKVVWWTAAPYAQVPINMDDAHHLEIVVELDGKEVRATVDTGASISILNLEEAERLFGFNETSPDVESVDTASRSHTYKYPFKLLNFEGVAVSNPDIRLYPSSGSLMADGPKMIIGMNILRHMHMYVAYHEQKIYLTAASAH
jgi:Aspartyl protease/gag-polyprotein putative aspartyl protease